jgi:hypothetical protein
VSGTYTRHHSLTEGEVAEVRRRAMQAEVDELSVVDVLVETNEGTYGSQDVVRAGTVGGQSDYRIYESVGSGQRRVVGCDPARAPGRPRFLRAELAVKRERLAHLRNQLADGVRS